MIQDEGRVCDWKANMTVELYKNPRRGTGLTDMSNLATGEVVTDSRAAIALYEQCPQKMATPLEANENLANRAGVANVFLKREDSRMGLGSFKALGAAFAIAKAASRKVAEDPSLTMEKALQGETFICASAGNHGLSVAAGAKLFGARAVVLLADTVPEGFAQRLRDKGAQVVRAGADYEASIEASKKMATEEGWNLLSDGSWLGYSQPARDVMEGYLIMGHEVADQMDNPPTHVFLQAGVGGLAAACSAVIRQRWGTCVTIVVVEPDAAPALMESVKAGTSVDTNGPVSSMGRLDCKTPSHLALKYLAGEADFFLTVDDGRVESCVALLADMGIKVTPSGAAGVAALLHLSSDAAGDRGIGLAPSSRVLCYLSEGAG